MTEEKELKSELKCESGGRREAPSQTKAYQPLVRLKEIQRGKLYQVDICVIRFKDLFV